MINSSVLIYLQLFLTIVMGLYFWNLLKSQESQKVVMGRESRKELERLKQLRQVRLSEPLTEKTRPASLSEVVGQSDGIKALKAGFVWASSSACDIVWTSGCRKDRCSPVGSRRGQKE